LLPEIAGPPSQRFLLDNQPVLCDISDFRKAASSYSAKI
jgi:hypothetical protein